MNPPRRLLAKGRQVYYQRKYDAAAPDPYQLIEVSPSQIQHWTDHRMRSAIWFSRYGTQIVSGDWERKYLRSEPSQTRYQKMFDSLQSRLVEGDPWEETEIYDYILENAHSFKYDPEYVDTRLENLERVYRDMRENGYKTQREIQQEGTSPIPADASHHEIPSHAPPEIHEVAVAITREGEFCWFFAGHHRLMLAKIAEVDRMPVRVVVRHNEWQKIRVEVANADSRSELSEEAKMHLDHPDISPLISESMTVA